MKVVQYSVAISMNLTLQKSKKIRSVNTLYR